MINGKMSEEGKAVKTSDIDREPESVQYEIEQSRQDRELQRERVRYEIEQAKQNMALERERVMHEIEQSIKDRELERERVRHEIEQDTQDRELERDIKRYQIEKERRNDIYKKAFSIAILPIGIALLVNGFTEIGLFMIGVSLFGIAPEFVNNYFLGTNKPPQDDNNGDGKVLDKPSQSSSDKHNTRVPKSLPRPTDEFDAEHDPLGGK